MFEIIFLGTSASAPSIQRGLSSAIIIYNEHRFLIDCGEGTQRQILRSGIGFRRLNKILLTHGHLDHILGLGGLISTFVRWEAIEEIDIWGGKSTLERVKKLIFDVVLRRNIPGVDLNFHTIRKGSTLMEFKDFTVTAFPVRHRGPGCYGYMFEEKARRPFNNEKAVALGVPDGPWRRELVEGKDIRLDDGRVIRPDDVLGDEIPGKKICFTGDAAITGDFSEYIKDADLLITEATYLDADHEMAEHYGHMTAKGAAEIAKEAGVKNLILTHISRRDREADIRDEAGDVFPGAIVARDFDHYRLRKDEKGLEKVKRQ